MTTALNYRFQLLREAGSCDPLLLQVLALLVAHANENGLPRTPTIIKGEEECRRPSPPPSRLQPAEYMAETAVTSTPTREAALLPSDPLTLETTRILQENIVRTTESALQHYAKDVRRINDIAVGALEKTLRTLERDGAISMEVACEQYASSAADHISEEWERRQQSWLVSSQREVAELEERLRTLVEGCHQQQEQLEAYGSFLAGAHESLLSSSLISSHQLIAASLLLEEELEAMVASTASKYDLRVVKERLDSLEAKVWGTEGIHTVFDAACPTGADDTAATEVSSSNRAHPGRIGVGAEQVEDDEVQCSLTSSGRRCLGAPT